MFNNILKGVAICSVISLSLLFCMNSTQASITNTNNNDFIVNGEVLTEDEYWEKIEALGVEVTDSMKRDKFIPEDEACANMNPEEFYNYISALVEEPDEIYVLGFTEVSEEEFYRSLNEEDDDYPILEINMFNLGVTSSKSKIVARRNVGSGKINLIINYDVEIENKRRYISSASADLEEENIPDNYEWSATKLSCSISDNQKRAKAVGTGDLYRIVPKMGKDIRIKSRVVLRGSVSP